MTALGDPLDEARRMIEAARGDGVTLRAVGGVGVALVAPTVRHLVPRRTYHDIDLVGRAGSAPGISRVLIGLGYAPAREFNALNGSERLLFRDGDGRHVDVFIDTLRMCHELPFRDRLAMDGWPLTLAPSDLLLSKLQIVEQTDRDAQDVLALLADHELAETDREGLGLARLRQVTGNDWGWWRTVDENLARLIARWTEPAASDQPVAEARSMATDRAGALRRALETGPRSIGWRIRSVVGPRLRWYELPEEVR
jgi:hypothetical protein